MTQPFPTAKVEWNNAQAELDFSLLQAFVSTSRTGRALLNIPANQPLSIFGTSTNSQEAASLKNLQSSIESILRSTLTLSQTTDWPSDRILQLVNGNLTIGLPVEPNLDLQQVVKKVKKQIDTKQKECSRLESRISSPAFREKAEPSVIQESKERVISLQQELALLTSSEQQLGTMLR